MNLIHHSANRGSGFPPSSLPALRSCIEAGARLVEVDIIPLAGGDFALLHDERLEHATDGQGAVAASTASEIRATHYTYHGSEQKIGVGVLSDALELIAGPSQLRELQLDLKAYVPLSDDVLVALARLVAPVKHKVRISSAADWAIRRLHERDPELRLGFDPMFYLDVEEPGSDADMTPPFRTGAYGYRDGHPLSARRWGTPAAYLAARAEALHTQVPARTMWFIRASLLARMLEDGFDWIGFLHARGAEVVAWTLNPDRPGDAELARRMAAAGVDRMTTDDAPALAAALDIQATY